MPSISFQPVLKEIRDLFATDFYTIPRFQRPYSWTLENLQDFCRDVLDEDSGYFIGPMVAYSLAGTMQGIVDGQQRLTTLTLAMCALRDMFEDNQVLGLANAVHRYVERTDDNDQSHFVLRSDAAGSYLPSQILLRRPRVAQDPVKEEQRALKRAFDEISAWLKEQTDGLSPDRPDPETDSPVVDRLKAIRDRLLSLQVIWIQVDNEDDAYVIFETMNSRGKDLEVVDLLKNLLMGALRAENQDLDQARTTWNEIRAILEETGSNANPNKFILHWWLSRDTYTAERKLFGLMRSRFRLQPQAGQWLESLRSDATHYARISNPAGWQCRSHERPIRDSLAALNIFNVRQPRPLLLALLRALDTGDLKVARVRKILQAVESFHFITTAIVGVSSTGGISEMYAKHAREVTNAAGPTARQASLDNLIDKLADSSRLPQRASFISEFPGALRFSEEYTSSKRLVQYALRRLHEAERPGRAIDHSRCNIEHIESQAHQEDWMPGIGNLLWVEESLNQRLGSRTFVAKQQILEGFKETYEVGDILAASEWTAETAATRSKRLAELAYDKVWRIRS